MDRVNRIIGSKWAHDRGIRGKHIGIAVLDTGERVIMMLIDKGIEEDIYDRVI